MTTAIALASAQLPAYLTEFEGSSVLDAVVSGLSGGSGHPRISIRASRFRIVEGGVEQTLQVLKLAAVVVGANTALSRQYYPDAYDAENSAGPACFSDDGVGPDVLAPEPQSDKCATCPQSVWGSKISPNGKEIKACSDVKRIALLSSDDMDGSVYEFQVSPSALKGFNEYAKELRARRIPIEAVITLIGFDDTASYPKVTFEFGGFLDRDSAMKAREISQSDLVKDVVRQKDTAPVVVAPPTPKVVAAPKVAPKAVAAPKPTPVQAEPEVLPAEVEAPAAPAPKTRGFGAAAATPAAAPKATPKPVAKPAAAPKPAPAVEASLSDFEAELAEFAASGAADDAEE